MGAHRGRTQTPIELGELDEIGKIVLEEFAGHPVFVARVKSCLAKPRGALPTDEPDEYIVAFSRVCTHMGCHVVGKRHHGKCVPSLAKEHVIRCPCHLTCFDLCKGGLVVIGQASSPLAQVELQRADPTKPTKGQFVRWMDLPYGETCK